jgi:chaperonin GroEL (HSP60 family)
VPGAGATEIELTRQIESLAEKCAGLEQYAMKKYAHAMEALAKQLSDNAGLKVSFNSRADCILHWLQSTDVLPRLYTAHEKGERNAGINVETGEVLDAVTAGIFDLYSGKKLAIRLATNAAITVLKVDQVGIDECSFISPIVCRSSSPNRLTVDRNREGRKGKTRTMSIWPDSGSSLEQIFIGHFALMLL